jgi:hypothetical protein
VSRARELGYALGRADAVIDQWHQAKEAQAIEVRRAAQLLRPRLSFVRSNNPMSLNRAEVVMPSGTPSWALRLSPIPESRAPGLLRWAWFDGLKTTVEPVAKLLRQDGMGATYGIVIGTRAGRDFRAMIHLLETAGVDRMGEVNFGEE